MYRSAALLAAVVASPLSGTLGAPICPGGCGLPGGGSGPGGTYTQAETYAIYDYYCYIMPSWNPGCTTTSTRGSTTTRGPTTTTTPTTMTYLAADGAKVVWAHTTGVSGSGMQFDLPRPIAVEAPPGYTVHISSTNGPDPIDTGLARIDDLEAYLRTLPDNAGRGFGDLMWIRQNGHVWDYHRRDFYVHAEVTTTTTGTTVTTTSAADATGATAAIGAIADALSTLAQQIQLAVTNLENGVAGLA